jgi:hypothetical protein
VRQERLQRLRMRLEEVEEGDGAHRLGGLEPILQNRFVRNLQMKPNLVKFKFVHNYSLIHNYDTNIFKIL